MPRTIMSGLILESYTNMDLTKGYGFVLNTKTAVVVSFQKWSQWCPPARSIFIASNEVGFQGIIKNYHDLLS